MRKSYILYRRPGGGRNGKVYYVAFWNPEAKTYGSWRSTGHTGKGDADGQAKKWEAEGLPARGGDTFASYLKAFWTDGGDFAKMAAARRKDRRPLSFAYLSNNRRSIEKYVIPYLEKQKKEKIPLAAVTAALLEGLMRHLMDNGVISPRTINTIRQAVAVPLGEAERLGRIAKNPARKVRPLQEGRPHERIILDRDEVNKFFALEWEDPRFYVANLLAATTGMRMGEVRGLMVEDIRPGTIHVCHNAQDREGIKVPKSGNTRDVALPPKTEKALHALIRLNPWKDGLVFYSTKPGHPLGKKMIERSFNAGLDEIGIKDPERSRRGLTFHSWRHWYNSMMRGKVPDYQLRALTGHASEQMTARYTEITGDQRKVIARLANGLIGGKKASKLPSSSVKH
ncbi:MAG: tyrosine-type recombinase/integrase [Spirochaetia bacterium]|jgi:integrase